MSIRSGLPPGEHAGEWDVPRRRTGASLLPPARRTPRGAARARPVAMAVPGAIGPHRPRRPRSRSQVARSAAQRDWLTTTRARRPRHLPGQTAGACGRRPAGSKRRPLVVRRSPYRRRTRRRSRRAAGPRQSPGPNGAHRWRRPASSASARHRSGVERSFEAA
ncbi:hypothetical protein DWV00_14135 [Trinickia dinghuensis]|uniref:Uncharacterized protein n=1 Tax=Trinickia dinghuensis TaxID=2291023 RepID=A0A3D8K0L3_9BURK|nr:hypothetical protein DWV00_14135 [Trinickia dinghuensis]